jgi:hypothetical protein
MTSRTLTSFPASAASPSPQDGQDSAQSPFVKLTPSARKSSRQGSGLLPTPNANEERAECYTRETSIRHLEEGRQVHLAQVMKIGPSSFQISSPSTEPDSEEQLCLPGASPASLSVTPGSDEARRMTVQSGLRCVESFTNHGPIGCLQRMLAGSSAWNSTKCLLTWSWKATPAGRSILELSVSTPRTAGCESGLLLTTPNVQDDREVPNELRPSRIATGRKTDYLSRQIAMMPLLKTPSSVETEGGVMEIRPGCDGHYKLRDQIAMLPTPTGTDYKSRGPNSKQVGIDNFMKLLPSPRAGNPGSRPNQKGGKILAEEVAKVGTSRGLKLQPAFVEWMMGYPLGFTHVESPDSRHLGTPSSPRSPTKSSRQSRKSKKE